MHPLNPAFRFLVDPLTLNRPPSLTTSSLHMLGMVFIAVWSMVTAHTPDGLPSKNHYFETHTCGDDKH